MMRGGDERSRFSATSILRLGLEKTTRCALSGRFISTDLTLMGSSTLARRQRLFESAIAPANFAAFSRNFAGLPCVLIYDNLGGNIGYDCGFSARNSVAGPKR
jgi:hypothetical protein